MACLCLIRAVTSIVWPDSYVLGQDLPEVLLTADQEVVEALAPHRPRIPLCEGDRAGTAGRDHHGFDARAGKPSQASNQVNVLVAGLHGRCPCLSAVSPARPSERTDA